MPDRTRLLALAEDRFQPNEGCKAPHDCRRACFCLDGWHCASVADAAALRALAEEATDA